MPELASLLRVDIVSVIIAALLFYVVSVWFNVAAIWSELKAGDAREHFDSAVRFAWIWTGVVVLLVIALYIFRVLTKPAPTTNLEPGNPAWGGHDTSHASDVGYMPDILHMPDVLRTPVMGFMA